MDKHILTAPVFADNMIGQGRKNRAWFKTEVSRTRRGKVKTEKMSEDTSKGYIVFEHCEARQRRAIASAVDTVKTDKGEAIVFVCHKCHRRVPVLPPLMIRISRTVENRKAV